MHLSDEAREAQRRYQREWRKAHPDRVREKNRQYWERKAQREAEQQEDKHGQS